MNRLIKFRVWDKENKKLFLDKPITFLEEDLWSMLSVDIETGITKSVTQREGILMQFTGLYDKNGNEIWEKDIMKRAEVVGVVYFKEFKRYPTSKMKDTFGWCIETKKVGVELKDGFWFPLCAALLNDIPFKIIGNIYENPELLEVN